MSAGYWKWFPLSFLGHGPPSHVAKCSFRRSTKSKFFLVQFRFVDPIDYCGGQIYFPLNLPNVVQAVLKCVAIPVDNDTSQVIPNIRDKPMLALEMPADQPPEVSSPENCTG